MNGEIRKLLGGYATGTLTPEERENLFQASLDDPALFEALADEQALRELLDDPAARAELLDAIENRRFSMLASFRDWFERPKSKVVAGLGVVALVAIAVTQFPERRVEIAAIRQEPAVMYPAASSPVENSAPAPARPSAPSPLARSATKSDRKAALREVPAAPAGAERAKVQAPAESAAILQYSVLRRTASGDYEAVPDEYAFGPGDRARIRIQSQQEGTLLVKTGAVMLYAGTISPASPVVTRQDISFAPDSSGLIEITLSALPERALPAVTPQSAIAPQPDESPAQERAFRKQAPKPMVVSPAFRAAVLEPAGSVPPLVNLKIQLRRK